MLCPICRADETKVVDSRLADEGSSVRRRRQCLACSYRFTTFERAEEVPMTVVKSHGVVQPFDREKIASGVRSAAKGRPVDPEAIEVIATSVEDEMRSMSAEVTSSQIGLAVLDRLRLLDEVVYLRFASVYKNFDAAADFQNELELLRKAGDPHDRAEPTD